MLSYIEDISNKINYVNGQIETNCDFNNSNFIIVLDENEANINNYLDINAKTEITAKESSHSHFHKKKGNPIKKLDDENITVMFKAPENNSTKSFRKKRKFSKTVIYKCLKCKIALSTLNEWNRHEKICKHHRRVCKISRAAQCTVCYEVLKTQRLLSIHYKMIHQMERCKICYLIMPEGGLRDHLKLNHADDIHTCEFCEHITYSASALEIHTKKKHGDPQCIMCLKSFKLLDLRSHKCKFGCLDCKEIPCIHHRYLINYREQVLNEADKIQCLDCDYVCPKRETLLGHVNREHLDHHPFTCAHCSQQFYSKVTLRNHLNNFHKDNYACEFCDGHFKSQSILDEHVEICKWIKRHHKCEDCASSFDTLQELQIHKKSKHNEETFPCNLCNRKFFSVLKLKEHTFRIHSGIQIKKKRNALECTICDIKFIERKEYKQHIASHGSGNSIKFPCKSCDKDFDDIKKLQAHTRMHDDDVIKCNHCKKLITAPFYPQHMIYCGARNEENNLSCETCGKQFQTEILLKMHRQVHLDRITCQICGKLIKPAYLKRHLKFSHGQADRKPKKNLKAIKCEWCGHMVTRNGELESHVNRFHLKIKPYECNTCSKTFCGKERLREHIQTHSSEHTRYCTVCGKKFANQVCLKMHLRLHSGVTPYACDMCGEKFRSSSMMNTHKIKKHTEKTIPCPLCDAMFYLAREMRPHFKKVHWKNKGQKFDPRDVKELKEEFYYLFEDRRIPKVNDKE
ncbi:zinc finger protein 58 isoform X2 [Amyelois transitella]|nr:zinc finger protein 58 isoform X2 [Amyelois transitella]XP_060807992.1 zinc finger protein 58 isoform X2 [Amyelois transitella]